MTTRKRKNAQDATLRNVRATRRQVRELEARVVNLELVMAQLLQLPAVPAAALSNPANAAG